MLLGNLFRDQLDRYGELEIIADRWAEVVAAHARPRPRWCSTPTTRSSPTSGREQRRRSTSASTTTRSRSPSSSTRPTPSTAAAAAIPTPTRRSTSPTSAATRCPNCGARRPEPAVVARDVELRGIRSAAFTLVTPAGERARRAAAARPLQRLQRARRGGAVPAARRAAGRGRRGPARRSRRRSGARRRVDLGGRPTSILLVKNPAGANEVLRTLALEGEQLDLFGVLNDNTADGRDISWVWDADWELLAPLGAADDLLGHARGRARAADEVRGRGPPSGCASCRSCRTALDAALADGDGPLYALPDLHRAARAARPARPARPGRGALAMTPSRRWSSGTTSSAGGYTRRPRRCGASWPARERGPVLDVGAGHRARRARPRARRARRHGARPRAGAARRARARAPAALRVRDRRRRRARLRARPALRARSSCRCRRSSCCPSAPASSPRRAAHLLPGGLLAIAITARAGGLRRARGRAARARRRRASADWRFASQPTAVRALPAATRIERVRRDRSRPTARVTEEDDVIELAAPDRRAARGRGPRGGPRRPSRRARSPPTDEHVGSEVVLLRG